MGFELVEILNINGWVIFFLSIYSDCYLYEINESIWSKCRPQVLLGFVSEKSYQIIPLFSGKYCQIISLASEELHQIPFSNIFIPAKSNRKFNDLVSPAGMS
jgi:hypothetical protein